MLTNRRPHPRQRAFTLRELLVTVAMITLLVLLTAPGPLQLRIRYAQPVICADGLGRISQAVAACFAENNGYGPSTDDGEGPTGHVFFMFTWTDLLYDKGYLSSLGSRLCPADQRPDFVAEERGRAWGFYFVDWLGVGEPVKRGVRTSYALNMQMAQNFAEDKFEDASRQVYAMDGWWSWLGNLNAAWALYEQVTGNPPPDPVWWPNYEGTMHGWRHGIDLSANVLYLDGHVALLTPNVPQDPNDLLTDTVDTMQSFTWLPGERNTRLSYQAYHGQVPEYQGLRPFWFDPPEGSYRVILNNVKVPIDFPDELHCSWRTVNQAWVRLPNDPSNRR